MLYFGMNKVLPKEGKEMSTHTVKVAVSLPSARFKALELIRHKLSISRSAVVDEALRFWFASKEKERLIERYEKGYLEKPEDASGIKQWRSAQFPVFNREKWI